MISEQILAVLIGFGIGIILYLVITPCVNEYLWWKLKRHVIGAIEELDLWNAMDEHVITGDLFKSITTYLDAHKYRHCFHDLGGAFWLAYMLDEIRTKRDYQKRRREVWYK